MIAILKKKISNISKKNLLEIMRMNKNAKKKIKKNKTKQMKYQVNLLVVFADTKRNKSKLNQKRLILGLCKNKIQSKQILDTDKKEEEIQTCKI